MRLIDHRNYLKHNVPKKLISNLTKMDRFDKLNSYFVTKERKRLDAIAKDTKSGLPEMSVAEIKLSCMENGKSNC